MKSIGKSKTIIFAFLLAVFGAIETSFHVFEHLIGPEWYGVAFAVVGAIVAGLRVITKEPVKLKDDDNGDGDGDEHARL